MDALSRTESPIEQLEVDDMADVFVCLRGPCHHYFEQLEPAAVHNPEANLKQRSRTCLLVKADLTEGLVLDCNRWEPRSQVATELLESARNEYYEKNPHHDPRTADVVRLTQIRRHTSDE